jgi:uncharacterized protein YhaN
VLGIREAELERERQRALEAVRVAEHAREVRAQLQVLEGQQTAESESRRQARDRLAALEREFHEWKQEVGIPTIVGSEAAREFLDDLRRGRDALEDRDRLSAELRRAEAETAAFSADVVAVLADAAPAQDRAPEQIPEQIPWQVPGQIEEAAPQPALAETPIESPEGSEQIGALLRLRARCEADRAAREGREPLERRAADLRQRFVERERALESVRVELSALLEETGAEGVEQLQQQIAVSREAGQLQRRIESMESELARRLEPLASADVEALRVELGEGRVGEWEERAGRSAERIEEITRSRDEILREHQDRARDRERLEASTDVMDLELSKAALEQELREVLDEWRHLRLAGRLVETALERFEGQHQPGVLREASRLFSGVTGGRYARIMQTDAAAGFSVVSREGTHRALSELSRGTTEQLYLCIRLGLVAELARGGRSLPVVMDDVLVNFDDARATAMAEVLGAFAEEHQLLFFTCSTRTRDLLTGVRSDVDSRLLPAAAGFAAR